MSFYLTEAKHNIHVKATKKKQDREEQEEKTSLLSPEIMLPEEANLRNCGFLRDFR